MRKVYRNFRKWPGDCNVVGRRNRMRDLKRIDTILTDISTLWHTYPDWRLGQLLTNVDAAFESNAFYREDSDLAYFLEQFLNRTKGGRA